jgi:hypothetical protein
MSRMRRAWNRPSNNQKRVGVPFALPPLLDQLSKSPEIVYFVADSYLSCATSARFGFVGSRKFETRDPRPHKALGSDLIILERVSE